MSHLSATKSAFLPFDQRLALISDVIKPRYAELLGGRTGAPVSSRRCGSHPRVEEAWDCRAARAASGNLRLLAPGSPMDSLDDRMRDGGFRARRKLKSRDGDGSIGWRSVIGRLAPVIDFRD